MKITTKGRYGVRAVLSLAQTSCNRPVSIKTIAANENLSPEFLEQIFFKLKKAGIINSFRGPGGGFILNRKTSEITLKDIFAAVQEPIAPVPCSDKKTHCERQANCVAVRVWQEFYGMVDDFFSRTTLKDILDKNGSKAHKATDKEHNFSI
jgi:Rrf2 family transcriptional regulator, iron-sulfur cluster assembly transcription factor